MNMDKDGLYLPTDTSENPPPDDWGDVTWAFVTKITKYVPGAIGWIAQQRDERGQWTNLWGFVVGDKFACVDLDAMRSADDTFVRQIATKMLGYAPDSRQDLESRKMAAESEIAKLDHQMQDLMSNRAYFEKILASVEALLATAPADAAEGAE